MAQLMGKDTKRSGSVTNLPEWFLVIPTLEFSSAIEAIKTGLQAIADSIQKFDVLWVGVDFGSAAESSPAAERLYATETGEPWRGMLGEQWRQADGLKSKATDDKKEAWKGKVLHEEGINGFSA